MDPATPSQQDSWQNNIYILSTTRVLMVVGLAFLTRSSYQLYQRMRSSGNRVTVADASEIDLEALALGALSDVAMSDLGPVDDINEAVDITVPQSTYIPRGRSLLRTL